MKKEGLKGHEGGMLVGARHSEGGIPAVVKTTGQKIEMEGGEVVITKPAVSDKRKRLFEGEMLTNREILSRINQSGGGVAFADGGEVPEEIAVSGKEYDLDGKKIVDYEIVSSCGCKHKGKPSKYAALGMMVEPSKVALTDHEKAYLKKLHENSTKRYYIKASQRKDIEGLINSGDIYLIPVQDAGGTNCRYMVILNDGKMEHGGTVSYAQSKKDYAIMFRSAFHELMPDFKQMYNVESHEAVETGLPTSIHENLSEKVIFEDGQSAIIDFYDNRVISGDDGAWETANKMRMDAERRVNNEYFAKGGEVASEWLSKNLSAYQFPHADKFIKAIGNYAVIQRNGNNDFAPKKNKSYFIRSMDSSWFYDIKSVDDLAIKKIIEKHESGDLPIFDLGEIVDVVTTNFPNSSVNEAMSGTNYVTVNGVLLVRVSTHNSNDLAQRQKPDIYFYNDGSKTKNQIIETIKKELDKKNKGKLADGGEVDLLFTGGMGGGVTVASDKNRTENGYYKKVAYIYDDNGAVKFFDNNLPESARKSIYAMAAARYKEYMNRKETPLRDDEESKLKSEAGIEYEYLWFKGIKADYKNAYELNKAIEEFLDHHWDKELTSDQKIFLSYYSGYGSLEKYGAEGKGIKYEFYTPSLIAKTMWGLAYKYGFKGGNVLESSCGIGEFIKYAPVQSCVTGYEINKYSAKIAQILYPDANINIESFEAQFIKDNRSVRGKVDNLKKYALTIGNPPYGKYSSYYGGLGEEKYTHANSWVEYFIFRGLDLLESGGLLIFVIGTEVSYGGVPFLAQQKNAVKEAIAQKAILLDAYRLPNGVFERTDVLTDIIVLKKK